MGPRARLLALTLLLLLMPPTDFTELMPLSPMESTLSMPQLLMPSMLPQLLPMLSMLPQLIMPQPQLTMPQSRLDMLSPTLMRSLHTPSPTLLLMTTPRLASTLRNSPMVLPTLPDLTLLLFLMAESNTSSTLPTDMMDMSLMSPMREPLSTQRPQPHTRLPQLMPQLPLITLKSEIPQKTSTTNPRQSQSTKKETQKLIFTRD